MVNPCDLTPALYVFIPYVNPNIPSLARRLSLIPFQKSRTKRLLFIIIYASVYYNY